MARSALVFQARPSQLGKDYSIECLLRHLAIEATSAGMSGGPGVINCASEVLQGSVHQQAMDRG